MYECEPGCQPSEDCWGCSCSPVAVCQECKADLDEIKDEVTFQADSYGMESLTEQQQAFLDGYQAGHCPDCII